MNPGSGAGDPAPLLGIAVERLTILHNPACSNSRKALETLRARGDALDVVEYLKTPLDEAALRRIVGMLDSPPADLVRKDKRFGELGLDESEYRSADQVVALLVRHPELMQRPVVVRGKRAIIARPGDTAARILEP